MPSLKATKDFLRQFDVQWNASEDYEERRKNLFDYYDNEIKNLNLKTLVDLGKYMLLIHLGKIKGETSFDMVRTDSMGNININTADWLKMYSTLKETIKNTISNEALYPKQDDKHPVAEDIAIDVKEILSPHLGSAYNPFNWFKKSNSENWFEQNCVVVQNAHNNVHTSTPILTPRMVK